MFNIIYNFLETHNCIYELQFGFRSKHSTNHAILSITQKIKEALDNGSVPVGIFVDFQKAFDTVNHDILLTKLNYYGIRGSTNAWFRSYLTNRKQFVSINGFESEQNLIRHGVPQGSVLGPLLFLIYINDLHVCIRNSTTHHFADDTNLLHVIHKNNRNRNPVRKLNTDLKCLNQWLIANKISLNSTKTELILFRKISTLLPIMKIKLNGVMLRPSSEIKYLGIILDEHLTFQPHIKILNAKLKRANNLLSISRYYVPEHILLQIYYGQFYSHLTYGCQVWGHHLQKNNQTFILQKKALRLLTFSDYQAHASPLFKKLKLLKLDDIIRINDMIFVHNAINGNVPSHFKDYFSITQRIHGHNTINNPNSLCSIPHGSLNMPAAKTKTGEHAIKYVCSRTWNSLLKELSTKVINSKPLIEQLPQDLKLFQLKKIIKEQFLIFY